MRRATRTTMPVLIAASIALAIGQPALSGGGWWSYTPLQGSQLGAGERFQSPRGEVLFTSVDEASRARRGEDSYYAYLLPDLDWTIVEEAMGLARPGDWWAPPAAAFRAGSVDFLWVSPPVARIRVAFDIPDVAPGSYALMLCSEGCAEPLADIVPSEITVTADPVTARTARELSRLEARFHLERSRLRHRLAKLGRDLSVMGARDADAELLGALEDAKGRVRDLERRVAELEGAAPALAWLAVGAAGAALLILLPRRRRPRERPPDPPRVVEMELEAVHEEPVPERTPVPAA